MITYTFEVGKDNIFYYIMIVIKDIKYKLINKQKLWYITSFTRLCKISIKVQLYQYQKHIIKFYMQKYIMKALKASTRKLTVI